MSFRILGLPPGLFRGYFSMSDAELQSIGAVRRIADTAGWPCRVSLEHAAIGEEVLLLNYEHQPGDTPYRSRHAIYVRRGADHAFDAVDIVPEVIRARLLSVRAFDASHMMITSTTPAAAVTRRASSALDRVNREARRSRW